MKVLRFLDDNILTSFRIFIAMALIIWFAVCVPAVVATDLQAAINALPKSGGTIMLNAGRYLQNTPLNLRGRTAVRIIGQGAATELIFILQQEFTGAPLIDMTGAIRCELSQFTLRASGEHKPSVGILLARTHQDGDSAGFHRFDGLFVHVVGLVANVANYGSEVNTWTHCSFANSQRGGGNYVTGRDNVDGIVSPFGPVAGGSNLCHYFTNCTWGVYGHTGKEVNIKIYNRTGWFIIRGGSMSNKSQDRSRPDRGGRAGFQIGGPLNGISCEQIVLDGLQAETWGAIHAVEITGLTFGLTIRNCLLESLESAIHIGKHLAGSLVQQNTLNPGNAEYNWLPHTRGIITVAAPCEENIFDLRGRRLNRLARDNTKKYPGRWPEYSISVLDKGSLIDNELYIRRGTDLHTTPGVPIKKNDLRTDN